MSTIEANSHPVHVILVQKYAYATISLILGIACFVNLAGLEKAILAVIFARLALNSAPPPMLKERHSWATAGLSIGVVALVVVPAVIVFNYDRLRVFVDSTDAIEQWKIGMTRQGAFLSF